MNLAQVRELLDGFTGRFFYDAESGDIGWIAKDCDDRTCDCERKTNSDGDQDCSHSLSDWEGEDHINEPLVRMLNAVPELLAEVERLRSQLNTATTIGRDLVAIGLDLVNGRAPSISTSEMIRSRKDRLSQIRQAVTEGK